MRQECDEAKAVLRKMIPVAQRALGEGDETTLKMRWIYGEALYMDDRATLDDLREAVRTLEETNRTARRVLGGEHPVLRGMKHSHRESRAALAARETPPPGELDEVEDA